MFCKFEKEDVNFRVSQIIYRFEVTLIKIQIILTLQMQENLLKTYINAKEDQNSSTSQSSRSSSSQSDDSIAQDLYRNIIKQLQKNEEKLKRVIDENSAFIFDLYRPTLNSNGQIKEKMNIELLQNQLDRLMEDDFSLQKELSKINFFHQENEQLKEKCMTKNNKNLSMLQTIWMKPLSSILSQQRIDQLNLRVVTIRNHVKQISMNENRESVELQKYVLQSKDYCDLKLKYEELKAQVNQFEQKQHGLNNQIKQLQEKIADLTKSNQNLNAKVQEQSNKLKRKDQEIFKIMQQNHDFELETIKKQKQLKKIMEQLTKQQKKFNPEKEMKQLKFFNKAENLTIIFQSVAIDQESQLPTTRAFKDIKNYLINTSALDSLIQCKSLTPKAGNNFLRGFQFTEKIQKQRPSKRNFLIIEQQANRSSLLGSQDKRKRFERTKMPDEQNLLK